MQEKEIFLNSLKELLTINDLSFVKFAEEVGINRRTILRWFDSRSPKAKSLIKIADYFNCSIDYLLGKTDVSQFCRSDENISFYKRYSLMREKNSFNDCRISILCDISNSTVSNWKNGAMPEFEILVKLCNLFDCTFDYLVGRSA